MILQTYYPKWFELSISKTNTPVEPLFKETKIMILNEIIKLENCLLALYHINQYLPLSLKNLLTNKNDLHNCSTQNSANHQLAIHQVKPPTMDYILLDKVLLNTGTLCKIV